MVCKCCWCEHSHKVKNAIVGISNLIYWQHCLCEFMRICTNGACSLFKVTLTHTYVCHSFFCGRLANKILSLAKTKSRIYSIFYELSFSCSLFGPSQTCRTYLLACISDKSVWNTKNPVEFLITYGNSKSIHNSKWKQKLWTLFHQTGLKKNSNVEEKNGKNSICSGFSTKPCHQQLSIVRSQNSFHVRINRYLFSVDFAKNST